MSPETSHESMLDFDGRLVGPGNPAYVIAEIGSNHDGNLDRACALIRASADAGADAVKFQSFRAETLCRRGEPAFPILERLQVPEAWHPQLRDAAADAGVQFLSTPFDQERAKLLHDLDVPAFKIASGDLTHLPLLRRIARYQRPMIVSTGLATADEVAVAVAAIVGEGNRRIALLHCVACYPANPDDMNLRSIVTLGETFDALVGLSDHTPGHAMVLASVALGAVIIEKHVTDDRALPGADHFYALTFDEFAAMVSDVRQVERALGDGTKVPAENETAGRVAGRRSVYAAVDIPAEATILPDMLKVVRPARGLAPEHADKLVGRVATCAIPRDEPLSWRHIR